jgi:hypothetical protein
MNTDKHRWSGKGNPLNPPYQGDDNSSLCVIPLIFYIERISLNFHPEAQLKLFRCKKIDLLAAGHAP